MKMSTMIFGRQLLLMMVLFNIIRYFRMKHEKDVFKTSMEIDQRWVIEHGW
jgi:hypothetical protein